MLQLFDDFGVGLSLHERLLLDSITDGQGMKDFLDAKLANMTAKEAKSLFPRFLEQADVPSKCIIIHMDNLRKCEKSIMFCEEALKMDGLTPDEKNGFIRSHLLAIHERGMMVTRTMNIIGQLYEKKTTAQSKLAPKKTQADEKPKPKNKPPDTLAIQPQLNARIASAANAPDAEA